MMKYELKELPDFTVIGLEQELTNRKSTNLERCLSFWPAFNRQLKANGLTQQQGAWTKFAFMDRREEKLIYYCGIPHSKKIPTDFLLKEIPAGRYLVVEHRGAMDQIYSTYEAIYQVLVPKLGLSLAQTNFLHFEKYGAKFQWSRENSIIEIWIPIKA
ncbi:GyrI-like domain-containing protein [Candidatus Enterococcus murrayae]|uniref:GyrI-like domain-containing protein n=1 Tax=Candidatus Enterococcus murrayae TaxID=2815321 RepID=A0ABS3HP92_9ENTE|nr:GyrI-like domain-containing protein [Enterococcus sp. MJM16]MBO0454847.1 GyrI-like domain-containing protein [Enterococcus sp. MJM16]